MKKKSIIVFTVGYPYGKGDEFLDPEIKCAEARFEKILIVSCDKKSGEITQYVPDNATIFSVRDGVSQFQLSIIRILTLFSFNTWEQIFICLHEKEVHRICDGIKAIILEQSLIWLLKRNEDKWVGKFDFFYSYWLSGAAAYLALRKEKLGGVLLARAHGYDCFSYRGFHPFRKEQLREIDYIFPISEAGKEDLITQGCNPIKLKVARLGVEKIGNNINQLVRADRKRVVTCSNIVRLKRLDLMVDALSIIDDIQIEWVHFGDGELKEEIELLCMQKLSEKKNIKYLLKGRLQLNQIFEYYSTTPIDCFINCSDVEGIPVSIMEAMAYGIPCIARDVGGNSEIVNEGVNGYLLPKNCSSEQLAEAIEKILSLDTKEYDYLRLSAFYQYMEKYNAINNYEQFWNIVLKDRTI